MIKSTKSDDFFKYSYSQENKKNTFDPVTGNSLMLKQPGLTVDLTEDELEVLQIKFMK